MEAGRFVVRQLLVLGWRLLAPSVQAKQWPDEGVGGPIEDQVVGEMVFGENSMESSLLLLELVGLGAMGIVFVVCLEIQLYLSHGLVMMEVIQGIWLFALRHVEEPRLGNNNKHRFRGMRRNFLYQRGISRHMCRRLLGVQ